MRSTLVYLLVIGCGGGGTNTVLTDGGLAGDATDGAAGPFCDGSSHVIFGNGQVRGIAVDTQGGLLLLEAEVEPRHTIAVYRFLAGGAADTAYGDLGVATSFDDTLPQSLALLPNGHILVGGGTANGVGVVAPLLLGLDATGQPDGFRVTEPTTSSSRYVDQVMVQDTSYVVSIDGSLRRVTAAGTFDPTFGSGSDSSYPIGLDGVVETSDGGFVDASVPLGKLQTLRLSQDGAQVAGSLATLDTSALSLTRVLTHGSEATLVAFALHQSDGTGDIIVGRVGADNAPDATLGGGSGFVLVETNTTDQPESATELADGSVLIGTISNQRTVVLRVAPDGTLAKTYPIDASDIGAMTVWNGMLTVGGNKSSNTILACMPL